MSLDTDEPCIGCAPVIAGHMPWHVECGSAEAVLPALPTESIDAVVTDPPAGIGFMGKAWDRAKDRGAFLGMLVPILREALRVTKPGGRLVCWSIPRTMHWTMCAIEDAGWLIENTLADYFAEEVEAMPSDVALWLEAQRMSPIVSHLFGNGFPKAKSQLKPAREDWIIARKPGKVVDLNINGCRVAFASDGDERETKEKNQHADHENGARTNAVLGTDERARSNYNASGRWPSNIAFVHAAGCVRTGVALAGRGERSTLSADCTQEAETVHDGYRRPGRSAYTHKVTGQTRSYGEQIVEQWQCVDGCPVLLLNEQSGEVRSSGGGGRRSGAFGGTGIGFGLGRADGGRSSQYFDVGGASRFFHSFVSDPFVYMPKASPADRNAGLGVGKNRHETVKSTALMRHLVRLVRPLGVERPIVLDMFAGSGSTGRGALLEGCAFVGIERDPGHAANARLRIAEAEQSMRAVQPSLALEAP